MLNGVMSAPVSALERAPSSSCDKELLGLKAWHNGLPRGENCSIVWPSGEAGDKDTLGEFIVIIVENIVSDLLLASALTCVGFVIYGGYKLALSAGDPAAVAKGKKTVSGALIGMGISLLSYAIVNFVMGTLFN